MLEFDVRKMAKLAKLKITEQEEKMFSENISNVIKMFDNLDKYMADFGHDEKLEHVLLEDLRLMKCREDVVEESMSNSELVSNSPKSIAGCIVVPKVLD